MADEKLLEKLMQDKDFVGKVVAMPTPEDVQKAFKDKGVDLSIAEVENFGKILSAAAENKGKLPDDALIASGGLKGFKDVKLKKWHKIAIAGGAATLLAGGSAGLVAMGYKRWSGRSKLNKDGSVSTSPMPPSPIPAEPPLPSPPVEKSTIPPAPPLPSTTA